MVPRLVPLLAPLLVVSILADPERARGEESPEELSCAEQLIENLLVAVEERRLASGPCRDAADPIEEPSGSSGNRPILWRAALVVAHDDLEAARDLLPFLRGEGGWSSHNGSEGQSWVYEAWNVAAVLAVLERARRLRAGPIAPRGPLRWREIARAARIWLRTEWTKLALSGAPLPEHLEVQSGLDVDVRRPWNRAEYRGLWSGAPGERMLLSPGAASTAPESSALGPLLSWALDAERVWSGPNGESPRSRQWTWVLEMISRLHGAEYHTTLDAEVFGLTVRERLALHELVLGRRVAVVRRVSSWLEPFRPLPGRSILVRAYRDGRLLSVLESTGNSNDPGVNVTFGDASWMTVLSPSPWRRQGAARSIAGLDEPGRVAWAESQPWTCRPGNRPCHPDVVRQTVALPSLGEALWQVTWSVDGVDVHDFVAGTSSSPVRGESRRRQPASRTSRPPR